MNADHLLNLHSANRSPGLPSSFSFYVKGSSAVIGERKPILNILMQHHITFVKQRQRPIKNARPSTSFPPTDLRFTIRGWLQAAFQVIYRIRHKSVAIPAHKTFYRYMFSACLFDFALASPTCPASYVYLAFLQRWTRGCKSTVQEDSGSRTRLILTMNYTAANQIISWRGTAAQSDPGMFQGDCQLTCRMDNSSNVTSTNRYNAPMVPESELSQALRSNTALLPTRRVSTSLGFQTQILDGAFWFSGKGVHMFCFRLRIRQRMKLYTVTIGPQAIAHYSQARVLTRPGIEGGPKIFVHSERSVNTFLAVTYAIQEIRILPRLGHWRPARR